MYKAFLFPGQGSQYVGMGKDLYDADPLAKALYDLADNKLSFDFKRICFEGPEEDLKQTRVTQPALFVHSVVVAQLLQKKGVRGDTFAGHSLGEYSALVAAGVLDFTAGLDLVALRGQLMQNAGDERPGTMAAILGLNMEQIENVCLFSSIDDEVVVPANINAPGQIVVSGDVAAVERAMEMAREQGAKKVIQLVVSGAFHSPLMEPAANKLAEKLNTTNMRPANMPVYLNVTGKSETQPEKIRERLVQQLTHPVRWEDIMRNMVAKKVSTVIELGPGKVLQGLAKRVERRINTKGVDTWEQVEQFSL